MESAALTRSSIVILSTRSISARSEASAQELRRGRCCFGTETFIAKGEPKTGCGKSGNHVRKICITCPIFRRSINTFVSIGNDSGDPNQIFPANNPRSGVACY